MDRSILDVHYTCRIWGKKFSSWALEDDINFAKKKKNNNKKEGKKEDKITKKQMMLRKE